MRWRWLIEDYRRIRDLIEQVFPDFKDFNARVAVPGGFRLYNSASERVWKTGTGKANFYAHPIPRDTPVHRARRRVKDAIVFTLQTTRSHDQYNTTIYGHDDRYRGVFGQRRVLFINREDIRALGFKDGDWVDILTVWGRRAGPPRRPFSPGGIRHSPRQYCRVLSGDEPAGAALFGGIQRGGRRRPNRFRSCWCFTLCASLKSGSRKKRPWPAPDRDDMSPRPRERPREGG